MEPLSLLCTCGHQAVFYGTSQIGDGRIDHIDAYVCPYGHMVQVVYPVIGLQPAQRMKPSTPPPFPGRT